MMTRNAAIHWVVRGVQRVEDTEYAATQHIVWAEVEEEILAVDAVVAALEALPLTTDVHVVDRITLEETTFVQVLRGRIDRWKGYMPMLRKLCDTALQAHHWRTLWLQLTADGGGDDDNPDGEGEPRQLNPTIAWAVRAVSPNCCNSGACICIEPNLHWFCLP
jgi:hypothetical protein